MPGKNGRGPRDTGNADAFDDNDNDVGEKAGGDEYDAMLLLDQLETLEEEMEELGVTTLDEVRQRIQELHRSLDK